MQLAFLIFSLILNNIGNFTFQYAAKIIDLHRADPFSLLHSIDGCTADPMFIDQCIGGYFLFL